MMTKEDLRKAHAMLKDDLRIAYENLRAAERRNREIEKVMQQIVAGQTRYDVNEMFGYLSETDRTDIMCLITHAELAGYQDGASDHRETVLKLQEELRQMTAQYDYIYERHKALMDTVQHQMIRNEAQSTCPYVVSSDEGTQSCRLNGTLESVLEAIEKELESIPESSYSFQWQENGYGRKPGNFFACEAEWEIDTEDELCQGLGKTRIEAATACLEEIRRAKGGD